MPEPIYTECFNPSVQRWGHLTLAYTSKPGLPGQHSHLIPPIFACRLQTEGLLNSRLTVSGGRPSHLKFWPKVTHIKYADLERFPLIVHQPSQLAKKCNYH